jgi:hydroxymethylpyrimidine pyrophosphatase-like HAD family hydrolase
VDAAPSRPLRLGGHLHEVRVVATDLDGTLRSRAGLLDAAAVAALADLRSAGLATILATGRGAAEVEALVDPRAFTAFVLEGGAVAVPSLAAGIAARQEPWVAAAIRRMTALGIDAIARTASISVPAEAHALLRDDAALGGLAVHLNRDRIDVTRPGIGKGTGLARALAGLPPPRRRAVVAFGDAANDAPLLEAADVPIAVADAEPPLLAQARHVVGPGGSGVGAFLQEWLHAKPVLELPARRRG